MDFENQKKMTEALTEAIQIISNHNTGKKEANLIISAQILKVVNLEESRYQVKYLSSNFEVSSLCREMKYSEGDLVYIIIPNGDFNSDKFILSLVAAPANLTLDIENTKVLSGSSVFSLAEYINDCIDKKMK